MKEETKDLIIASAGAFAGLGIILAVWLGPFIIAALTLVWVVKHFWP